MKLSLSNSRREKPTYRFGLDKKANESRFFSNEHAYVVRAATLELILYRKIYLDMALLIQTTLLKNSD